MRALIRSDTAMTARTPRPMKSVIGFASFTCPARIATRWSIGPSGEGSPRTSGNWEMKMCAEIPARKPIVTGIERRSAIQPRRKIAPETSTRPTMSASAAASPAYSAEPDAARRVRPPAKIGVMVESAPQDRKRLFPKKANASEPPRKAKNPISGENPPRLAVAICSGIAMAARVRPATRSHVKNRGRYESRERNTSQALFAPAKRGFGEPGVFAMNSSPHRKLLAPAPPTRSRTRWPFLAIEPRVAGFNIAFKLKEVEHPVAHWDPTERTAW